MPNEKLGGHMKKPKPEGKVLLGNVVRPFLDAGESLLYKPFEDDMGNTHWFLFGVRADGSESQVFIARNGEPKRFRSANAVISYHQNMFPDCEEVRVPVLPIGRNGHRRDVQHDRAADPQD